MVGGTRVKTFWLGLAALLALGAAAPPPAGETTWAVILADDGARLGHASETIVEGPDGRQVIDEQLLVLSEKGSPVRRQTSRTVIRQDAAGRVVSIVVEARGSRSWTRHEAVIEPGQARILRRTALEQHSFVVPLPPGVRFDSGEPLLRDGRPGPSEALEFLRLDVESASLERVVIVTAPDGSGDLIRRRYDGDDLRGVARLKLSPAREIVEVVQPMFGFKVVTRASDRETALKPHPPFRLMSAVLTKSPFRIPSAATAGHIRYRFGFHDGLVFPLPATPEQRIAALGETVSVDVCRGCGPDLASDPASLAAARKATPWLQSDHARLRAIAGPIARQPVSDRRKMELLVAKARPYLGKLDFAGHYSALEALQRRRGDCTEAAVLLAALGRSAGIPTKVVNGLVYSRERYHGASNVFMPHSWTLAYVDGAWRSFDLALDDFDATHIALTIGDGDARSVATANQLAGLLRLDGMVEVRKRPSP
jgi:hypothetical protein